MIYATTSLWNHLPSKDQKILTHFVKVCSILVSRILEIELMEEAHKRLIKIIKLIEVHYGRVKITPNLHLSLHLYDYSNDFGLLYAFWYFSFERMNGILSKIFFFLLFYFIQMFTLLVLFLIIFKVRCQQVIDKLNWK